MDESGQALIKKHGFSSIDYERHVKDLVDRFSNVALGDTVARVAKDPMRKLRHDDRLIGGAKLALAYGIEPSNFLKGIRAALAYDNPEDKEAQELQVFLKKKGLDWVLREICGLDHEGELFRMIKAGERKK